MSTGGEEVGKISIRVVPELDRFRAELLKELQFWEKKTLKIKVEAVGVQKVREEIQSAAKDAKADIKTDATNVAQTRAKIKAGVEGIKSTVKVEVDQASLLDRFERRISNSAERAVANYEPKLNLTVDDEILRRSIEDRLATLRGLAALPVHVNPEIATKDKLFLEAEFQSILTTLQAHADADKIKIKFDADAIQANEQMQRALSKMRSDKAAKEAEATRKAIMQIADGRAENAVIKARLDRDMFDLEWMQLQAEVSRRKLSVLLHPDPKISEFAWIRAKLEAMFHIKAKISADRDVLGNMAKSGLVTLANLAEDTAGGIAKVGSSAGASIPSLFSFAGMIMIVVAAVAVLLPPLLALAAGFITLVPAFAAILAPVAAVALGLNGIKKAAENAGLFADKNGAKKGGGGLGATLDDIKQKVSDTFEKGLTPAFSNLKLLFPQITQSMVGVTQGLVDITTGFINAITSSKGMANIKTILDNVGAGLSAAAPGIQSFTDGILNLIAGISRKFPGIGEWFKQLGDKFATAMDNFTKPGEDGMSRLDHLIQGVRNGIEGLTGVFQAFWNNGMQNIQDPSFGQHMLDFFNHVRDFVTVTLPQLANGFESFSSLLNTIVKPFEAIGNVIDKVNKIPGFGMLSKALSLINPGAAAALKAYPDILNAITQDPAGSPTKTNPFQNVPKQAAEAGTQAKSAFKETFTLGGLADTSVGGNIDMQLNSQIRTAVNNAEAQLQALAPTLQSAIDTALAPLRSVATTIGTVFGALAPSIQASFSVVTEGVTTSIAGITTAFDGLRTGATAAFGFLVLSIGQQAGNIVTAISGAFTQIPGIVSQAFQPIVTSAQQSMTQTNTVITEGATQAVQTVAEIPGKMQAAISGSADVLAPAGTALMSGLKSGLIAGMADVLSYVDTIAGQIAAHKGPLPQDRQELIPAGEALMQGLGDGLDSGFQGVLERTKAMAKAIFEAMKEVFGSASGANFNFNFGGAQGQMADMAGSARTFSSSMGNYANSVKPAKIDAATKAQLDGMKQQNAEIDVQVAQLRAQKFSTDKAGKAALDAQIAELNARKANITATVKQMEYDAKYSDQAQQNDMWKGMNEKIANGVSSVGQGVINSFTSDLGISGGGALQGLAQYGMDLGNKFVFNVANMDDALMAKDREVNKQSLSYAP